MNKIAFCIGISDYDFASKLRNPINDAKDVGNKLIELGFRVILIENPDRIELLREISNFNIIAKTANTSVIYYAGHGIQSNGINYLIPRDANPQNETEIDFFCISIDQIIPQGIPETFKTNILIFDACRDNPFSRNWARNNGLNGFVPILAPSGTLIAFSTSPGKNASDGKGRNGLYTEFLLSEISKPDLSILQLFQNVRQKVLFQSKNMQLSWESTSLLGDFFFNPISFNSSDIRIITLRNTVAKIEESAYKLKQIEFALKDESTEGGLITGFFEDGKILKIGKQLYFESGRYFEDIYFDNDLPIYYRISNHRYNVPFNIGVELAVELGSESFDENKTRIIIQEYFIQDSILIGSNKIEDYVKNMSVKVLDEKIFNKIEKLIEQWQKLAKLNSV